MEMPTPLARPMEGYPIQTNEMTVITVIRTQILRIHTSNVAVSGLDVTRKMCGDFLLATPLMSR